MRGFTVLILSALALGAPALNAPAWAADDPVAVQNMAIQAKSEALLHDPMTPSIGGEAAAGKDIAGKDGDVTVVEFFDYQCPFSKAVQPRVEALLAADKKVRLIIKEFPILSAESLVASKAALASVKQGKYAAYHTAMMDHKGRLQMDDIWSIAKDVGLDVERLKHDMLAPEIADAIIANFNLARSVKVTGTPGFIVGMKIMTQPSAEIDFPKEVAAVRAARN